MKIAILTKPDYSSPRILADSLKNQLIAHNVYAEIFYEISLLTRLVSFFDSKLSLHFWLNRKISKYFHDKKMLKKLNKFDAIIICECTPNGFLRKLYNIEKLKSILKKPILFYEVYYLGNTPSQIKILKENNELLFDRYYIHLAVSGITEIKSSPSPKWNAIGMCANKWNLIPTPKKELIAIVDFLQPGYENSRDLQIKALNIVGIKYISLEKKYSFEDIRKVYQQGAIFFLQFPEAFGVSILECLCCGNQIFTESSAWPMSWRLNEDPEIFGQGILPDCFTTYKTEEKLIKELTTFKNNYDLIETPRRIFNTFLDNYPSFYYGNQLGMQEVLLKLKHIKTDA